jgi:hypothetical protein
VLLGPLVATLLGRLVDPLDRWLQRWRR